MDAKTIVVLEGDETGQELLEESLRVLAPEVTGLDLEFPRFDLSLESRRASHNAVSAPSEIDRGASGPPMSVRQWPGQVASTRTPRRPSASSWARLRVSALRPALATR